MKKIVVLLIFCVYSIVAFTQDIHFSQFITTPVFINPANAGTYRGDYRAILNFKDQYAQFGGNNASAYRTYMVSYDMPIFKNSAENKVTGAGLSFFQDVAGDSRTRISNINLSISQTVHISDASDLTLGISGSYMQYAADYVGLSWGTQYNGVDYDPNLPTNENFFMRQQSLFDFSAGLLFRVFDYYGYPLEVGFSASHLTNPSLELLSNGALDNLPLKYVLHAKKEFEIENTRWGFMPIVFIANQRQAFDINVGVLARYDIGLHSKYTGYYKNSTIYFGASYRHFDAIIPQVFLTLKEKYSVGLSYDVNISQLNNASNFRGGLEVSLSMSGFFRGKYQVVSPVSF